MVGPVTVEFGRSRIDGDHHIITGGASGSLNRLADIVERLVSRINRRRKATLITDRSRMPGLRQKRFQRVKNLRTNAHGIRKIHRTNRHDHEFLNIQRVVGMRAAIHDVHHRRWQKMRVYPAKITPQRQANGLRSCARRRHRHTQNGVRTEPPLVGGAVKIDHGLVKPGLVQRVTTDQRVEDVHIHRLDGLQHTLATIARGVAITKLHRLMRTC